MRETVDGCRAVGSHAADKEAVNAVLQRQFLRGCTAEKLAGELGKLPGAFSTSVPVERHSHELP